MRFVGEWPSRMQDQWYFAKMGGVDINYQLDPHNLDNFLGGLPMPVSTFPKKLVWGEV